MTQIIVSIIIGYLIMFYGGVIAGRMIEKTLENTYEVKKSNKKETKYDEN
jgi:hypothetical protein